MSTTRVQSSDYADFRYQEAVGHLKQLLADGGSFSGRGSDAGSVRSRRPSTARTLGASGFHTDVSALRPEVSGFRSELNILRRTIATSRAELSSRRPEVAGIRPHSALGYPSRRLETLGVGSASVRDASPVSLRSFPIRDVLDGAGNSHDPARGGPDTVELPPGSQVQELHQLASRQEELIQQLELENTQLRDVTEELRSYIRQLVSENGTLADDLRSRPAESAADGAEARLHACRQEMDRLGQQLAARDKQLTAEHTEQLRTAHAERDRLADTARQLQADLERARQQADQAEKKAAACQQQAEQADTARTQVDNTVYQLKRELEAKDRRADQLVMEHERRLVAAREQAEQAVRQTFEELRQQLDRQADTLAQLQSDKQRHQRQEEELRASVEKHQQVAAQVKYDADAAIRRYQKELETLQQRTRPAAAGGDGRELAMLRQQLSAAQEQLDSASRERGRLQQQVRLLQRRPDPARDREVVQGVLGDDGMAIHTQQMSTHSRLHTTRATGSPQKQPTSYEKAKDSDQKHQRPLSVAGGCEGEADGRPRATQQASQPEASVSSPPQRESPSGQTSTNQPRPAAAGTAGPRVETMVDVKDAGHKPDRDTKHQQERLQERGQPAQETGDREQTLQKQQQQQKQKEKEQKQQEQKQHEQKQHGQDHQGQKRQEQRHQEEKQQQQQQQEQEKQQEQNQPSERRQGQEQLQKEQRQQQVRVERKHDQESDNCSRQSGQKLESNVKKVESVRQSPSPASSGRREVADNASRPTRPGEAPVGNNPKRDEQPKSTSASGEIRPSSREPQKPGNPGETRPTPKSSGASA